jgi:hypothetical protein
VHRDREHRCGRVDDSGGQFTGQQLCSSFIQSGWIENTAAEQQHSSAVASASASAARATQQSHDQQITQDDLAALIQDASFNNDLAAISNDNPTSRPKATYLRRRPDGLTIMRRYDVPPSPSQGSARPIASRV